MKYVALLLLLGCEPVKMICPEEFETKKAMTDFIMECQKKQLMSSCRDIAMEIYCKESKAGSK